VIPTCRKDRTVRRTMPWSWMTSGSKVHRWLYAMVGPGSDLEELTSACSSGPYSRLGRFDPTKGSFSTWCTP